MTEYTYTHTHTQKIIKEEMQQYIYIVQGLGQCPEYRGAD